MSQQSDRLRRIPLGSQAPLTETTRDELVDLGFSEADLIGWTELQGSSVVALKGASRKHPEAEAPRCFREEYDPREARCEGCIWMPHCWHGCESYLQRAHEIGYPAGVPEELVRERLPSRRKKTPPKKKPPTKKRTP